MKSVPPRLRLPAWLPGFMQTGAARHREQACLDPPVKPLAGPDATRFFTVNRKGNISPRWICRGGNPRVCCGEHTHHRQSSAQGSGGAVLGVGAHAPAPCVAVQQLTPPDSSQVSATRLDGDGRKVDAVLLLELNVAVGGQLEGAAHLQRQGG